eukprot:NODE_103_length_19640_cov_0.520905.p10 type:complete len:111 gc:universal NODE_103_length_19640_cov_0.520905:10461-10793(+)
MGYLIIINQIFELHFTIWKCNIILFMIQLNFIYSMKIHHCGQLYTTNDHMDTLQDLGIQTAATEFHQEHFEYHWEKLLRGNCITLTLMPKKPNQTISPPSKCVDRILMVF